MLSTAGLELTSVVNSETSWKVLKGNRSSSRRGRRAIEKVSDRYSEFVCVNSRSYNMPISESEKHHGDKLVPIKKRRFLLRSPSPPPKIPSVNKENPNFSKSHDAPVQSSVACPVSCKPKLGVMSVEKEDVQGNSPKKVSENLKSVEDFSGISMLAAAACSSSLGREFGYAEDGSGIEEPSLHEGPVEAPTNSEAQSLSKGLVREECVNTSDIFIGGTSSCVTTAVAGEFAPTSIVDCTSEKVENLEKSIKEPFHEDGTPTVSSDVSSMRDEDVAGSQNLQSHDHRLHWDLNEVMDAWEEPFDCQNAHASDHIFKGSENVVRCVGNRSAEDHDLLNEPKSSMCEVEKKLHYEPTVSLRQISEGNTRNQVDDFNHKNQSVSMCDIMPVSSECKNVPSSLGDGNISVQPLLFKCLNETSPVLKPFDIKKHADNEPTSENMDFDVAAPLFKDQRNLSASPVRDRNCAAVTKTTSGSVIDTQVRLAVRPTLDIENELTLKARMSDKPFDDRRQSLKNNENCAKIYTTSQVNNDATPEKVQKESDHPQRSSCLHEFTFNEVKMASAEHLEEKFISDAAADPCSIHETQAAGKLQDDNDSQYEDGELREPTELVLEEYGAVNEKTEHIDYGFDKSRYGVTSADHHDSDSGQITRIRHSAGNADIITSASEVANELAVESHRPIADDNDHRKDENLLKLIHFGDEKMKGPASSELSLGTVIRVRDDVEVKSRIYSLATRSPDSEATDTRTGSRLYGRGLLSQIEGPVGRDGPFREDQAVNSSKLDGVDARWDRGSSYMKSSERVRYPMQSQPRNHQINSWDGSSDVRRGIKRYYSPTYHPQVKPGDGDDNMAKGDRDGTLNTASYLSHGPTNDDSIAGNFQLNHKPHGAGRGRFIRYGRQMDHGAGRGRFHRPSDDTFQPSLKYRRPLSQRDRSFSPNERRGYQFAHQSHSRSPSRSRTRSPDPRVSPRRRSAVGDCGGTYLRHTSRSPNFRSEARMTRMRSPNQQRFRPFQRDHESPPSSRWINNRKDEPGHFTYKQRPVQDKSPNRIPMRGDRTDFFDSERNPKPYYRQNTGRFSEMDGDGRPHRLEENFENRRRQFGPIHNARRGYEDGPAKRLHHGDDGFVSTKRDVADFHGRGNNNRDIDNRPGDVPRRFRRDGNFMYERDGKFSSNSKQFGFGGMDSPRNFKSVEPYRSSINPGRFNEMDGADRGHRYEERRRQYGYIPRRDEMEGGIGRRLSNDVDDNLPAPQSSCNDEEAPDSHDRNPRSIDGNDGRVDDLPIRQREEEQQFDLSGQENKLGETSNSTDVQVPAEK